MYVWMCTHVCAYGCRSQRSKRSMLSDFSQLFCAFFLKRFYHHYYLLLLCVSVCDVGGHIYICAGVGRQPCAVSSHLPPLCGVQRLIPGRWACRVKHLYLQGHLAEPQPLFLR